VSRRFPGGCRISRLAGDASTRAYYRLHPEGGRGAVLAAYDAPFEPETFPFLETTGLFQAAGVRVPAVHDVEATAGVILLEDLGDVTVQSALETGPGLPEDTRRDLYRRAIRIIQVIQARGTPLAHDGLHAGREALDRARFRFELEFFLEHFILGLRGRRPAPAEIERLREGFDGLCGLLDADPRVLCHRDFHSRNLMILPSGELAVVDHQDARRGPDAYDLASLLRDAYVPLDEAWVAEMLAFAIQEHRLAAAEGKAFRQRFERAAAQRTLKAAGTFAAQKVIHGRDIYLRYLPRVLDLARLSLAASPELAGLRASLAALLPELR
jgi:aminoglycoside/choline kinase family phosphotransferase